MTAGAITMELAIAVPAGIAEELAALWSSGEGVELRDRETRRPPGERAEVVRVVAVGEVEREAARAGELLAGFRAHGATVDPWWWRARPLREADWRDAWRAYFHVQRVAPGLVVRPSWERATLDPGEVEIVIDPGRAFGTGTHASTRLCLRALAELRRRGVRVSRALDAGCGSGILAVAIALLWPAARVLAIDLDPDAVAVARENAALNGVGDRVEPRQGAVSGDSPPGPPSERCELVVANIQADVLVGASPGLARAVAPGGWLVLSGILDQDADVVARTYAGQGLRLEAIGDDDEWRCPLLRAP